MLSKEKYNELKEKCAGKFSHALRTGKVKRITKKTKCVDCGEPATIYNHRNYYEPLDVEPVCRRCNSKRGPAYPYCEDWGKPRAGNEAKLPDDEIGCYHGHLVIDFDFQSYDDHAEYLHYHDADDPGYFSFRQYISEIKTKDSRERWARRVDLNLYKMMKVKQSLIKARLK